MENAKNEYRIAPDDLLWESPTPAGNKISAVRRAQDLKLNLGCGPVQPQGWVNIDGSNRAFIASKLAWLDKLMVSLRIFPPTEHSSTTKFWNLFKPLPYKAASVDCVYAGELWEHFERKDAMRLTVECHRVLKPGGVLRICVPDGPTFWQRYLELYQAEMDKPAKDRQAKPLIEHTKLFFNDICTHRLILQSMGHTHKWQFDEVQLIDMLASAGFREVERKPFKDSRIADVGEVERADFLIVEGIR